MYFPPLRGCRECSLLFVIAGVSGGTGNMHEGKWICMVINRGIRMILCFHTRVYTPVFTVSFESDYIGSHTSICYSAPYLVP